MRFGKHDPIVTSDVFAAAAAQLGARRTRTPGKRYKIDWPLKGHVLYRNYRCRSTAGGREPCGHQVSAQAIETSVEVNVTEQLGRESQIWELIDVVVYYHRDGGIRVRVMPSVDGDNAALTVQDFRYTALGRHGPEAARLHVFLFKQIC